MEIDKEESGEPRRKDKRQAGAKRIKLEREELDKLRRASSGGQGAAPAKSKGKGKSKDQAGVQICYSFTNGTGPCGNVGARGPMLAGPKGGPQVPALPLPGSQKWCLLEEGLRDF